MGEVLYAQQQMFRQCVIRQMHMPSAWFSGKASLLAIALYEYPHIVIGQAIGSDVKAMRREISEAGTQGGFSRSR